MNHATNLADAALAWPNVSPEAQQAQAFDFDLLLAQKIASGDMLAFEQLYQRCHRRVYTLCLRMTNDVHAAEDLTQEIFIHVYHKISGFRGESSMMTWLYRVTVNKVLMHFRKNSIRREQLTEDGETPEPTFDDAHNQSHVPVLDRLALERAIEELPAGYRAVFILHDIEGYEHAEIARIRGNSVGTSKSQLHKARKRLMELLQGKGRKLG